MKKRLWNAIMLQICYMLGCSFCPCEKSLDSFFADVVVQGERGGQDEKVIPSYDRGNQTGR